MQENITSEDEKQYQEHLQRLTKQIEEYLKMVKQFERQLAVLSKVSKKTPLKFIKKNLIPFWDMTVTSYLKHNMEGFLSDKEKANFSYGLFIINGSEKEEVIEKRDVLIEQTIIEILLKCIEKENRRKVHSS